MGVIHLSTAYKMRVVTAKNAVARPHDGKASMPPNRCLAFRLGRTS
jgi:hypothetical protein